MSQQSAAQIAASRQNGAQSQGPISDEGKARSAQNSLKHGLCSKNFTLETPQEQARFDRLLAELEFTHQANNPLEQEACHHLAVAMWRRSVCDNLEKHLLLAIEAGRACAIQGGDGLPGLNAINRYRARIQRDLKEARAELAELKALRVKAFEAKIAKAREFASLDLLKGLRDELGQDSFEMFRTDLVGRPEIDAKSPEQTNPGPGKRHAAKLARKQKHKRK